MSASCETPIQWERFSLQIHAVSGTLYSLFAYMDQLELVLVPSVSHVPPIQHVLKAL